MFGDLLNEMTEMLIKMFIEMLIAQGICFIIQINDVTFVNTCCQLLYFYRYSNCHVGMIGMMDIT